MWKTSHTSSSSYTACLLRSRASTHVRKFQLSQTPGEDCLGNASDQQLPSILPTHQDGFFNPKTKTMHQLCAKPQYGGGNPFEHVGGRYGRSSIERIFNRERAGSHRIGPFNVSFGAKVNVYLATPRMLVECSFRCFCSNVTVLNKSLPKTRQRGNIDI